MSAEILREAAALMRSRAEAQEGVTETRRPVRYLLGINPSAEIRLANEHSSAWRPDVALAMADWLDEQAIGFEFDERAWTRGAADPRNRWEERGMTVKGNLAHHYRHALDIARAYLGADQ